MLWLGRNYLLLALKLVPVEPNSSLFAWLLGLLAFVIAVFTKITIEITLHSFSRSILPGFFKCLNTNLWLAGSQSGTTCWIATHTIVVTVARLQELFNVAFRRRTSECASWEGFWSLCWRHEWVLHDIVQRWPFWWIEHQYFSYEVFSILTDSNVVWKSILACSNFLICCLDLRCLKWRLTNELGVSK